MNLALVVLVVVAVVIVEVAYPYFFHVLARSTRRSIGD